MKMTRREFVKGCPLKLYGKAMGMDEIVARTKYQALGMKDTMPPKPRH